MSFFSNPDFFAIKQVDLESKLIQPTSQLYNQTCEQLKTFYNSTINALLDTHEQMAVSAKQVYEQPTQTLTEWYGVLQQNGNEAMTLVKNELLPKMDSYYQHSVTLSVNAGEKMKMYWQHVENNPKQVTDSLFSVANNLVSQLKVLTNQSMESLLDLGNLLVVQPVETVQALYRNSLSAVVDTYFDLVSTLLISI